MCIVTRLHERESYYETLNLETRVYDQATSIVPPSSIHSH